MSASKYLKRVDLSHIFYRQDSPQRVYSVFLLALGESKSLSELSLKNFALGSASEEFEQLLIQTRTLQTLEIESGQGTTPRDLTAAHSGLSQNTSLQALTLIFWRTSQFAPVLAGLYDHSSLKTLRLVGPLEDVTGLDALLCNNSRITELLIARHHFINNEERPIGFTSALQALGRKTALTKLVITGIRLSRDCMKQLKTVLRENQSLQSLVLASTHLWSAHLAEMAPALYRHMTIQVLDVSNNYLTDMESARLLREILRRSKTITKLDLSRNNVGEARGAIACIADGLGRNATLLEINLSSCC